MKNLIRFCALMFIFSVFAIACNQSDIVEDGGDMLVNKPLDYTYSMKSIQLDDINNELGGLFVETSEIIKREDCPALEHAQTQITSVTENCVYDDLYCGYLLLWWRIEANTAGINCGIDIYCEFCVENLENIDSGIGFLADKGLHPFYVENLLEKRNVFANLCATGCDG